MHNKKVKRAVIFGAMLALSTTATTSFADSSWLTVKGKINMDAKSSMALNPDFAVQSANLTAEFLVQEGLKAIVKIELAKALSGSSVDVERLVEEAYIKIETDKFGMPRALIIAGKNQVAFAQGLSKMPIEEDNLLYSLTHEKEVIGVTVKIPADALRIADDVAISLFETGAGDLQISETVGGSVKATKRLSSKLKAQVSAMVKQHLMAENEYRGSVGFVFDNGPGSWTVWAEGLVFQSNPEYPDSSYGFTAGASQQLGVGTIVVEYSYIERYAQELGAAYRIPVTENLLIAPEIRHRIMASGDQNTRIGVRASVEMQAQVSRRLNGN